MKKRGFTLVELLAVITILGILAVIITPVVTGILSKAEDDAYNKQVDNIVKAAKTWNLNNSDDLLDNALCTAVTELSIQYVLEQGNIQTGVLASAGDSYAYGVEYSCELGDGEAKTFYVLEDGDTTTLTEGRIAGTGEVSLIMSKNIDSVGKGTTSGNGVAWCSDETLCKTNGEWDNTKGPITANNYLISSTENWNKLDPSQISLPTAYQIATAEGKIFNNSILSGSTPWLKENLYVSGVPYGYWTSTSDSSRSSVAWFVAGGGIIDWSVDYESDFGIRPVITIAKTQIKNNTSASDKFYLSLDTLISEGIIENSEIINPKTNERMEGCISITYSEEYKQYEYKYISDDNLCK